MILIFETSCMVTSKSNSFSLSLSLSLSLFLLSTNFLCRLTHHFYQFLVEQQQGTFILVEFELKLHLSTQILPKHHFYVWCNQSLKTILGTNLMSKMTQIWNAWGILQKSRPKNTSSQKQQSFKVKASRETHDLLCVTNLHIWWRFPSNGWHSHVIEETNG